jgi:hypothetical protein
MAKLSLAGAPVNGENEVQRITGGGVISGGTWDALIATVPVADVPWDVTAAGLEALLEAVGLTIAVTGGPLASAAFNLEYTGPLYGGLNVAELTADATNLTGTLPSLTVATPHPGVQGTFRGAAHGTTLQDTVNGVLYVNTGDEILPAWELEPIPVERTLTNPPHVDYVDAFHMPRNGTYPDVFDPITT